MGKNNGKNGGLEEKQYGQLQSSLIESGFSIKRLLEVFSWLPVSSGILQVIILLWKLSTKFLYLLLQQVKPEEDNDYVKKQKLRLQERLELYQVRYEQ